MFVLADTYIMAGNLAVVIVPYAIEAVGARGEL